MSMKLNLGCGPFPCPGDDWTNIDIVDFEGVDRVCDLNEGIPFSDGSVEQVVMSHALEHIADPLFMLREIRRVCELGAVVEIRVPLLQYWQPDHLTCFYDQWFERNLVNVSGLRMERRKIDVCKNIDGDDYDQLTVWLEAVPNE